MKRFFLSLFIVMLLSVSYFKIMGSDQKAYCTSPARSVKMPHHVQAKYVNNVLYDMQNYSQNACAPLALITSLQQRLRTASPAQKPGILRLIAQIRNEHRRCPTDSRTGAL